MGYSLSFEEKPSYLHVIVTGENSADTVLDYLAEVLRFCKERGCRRLLLEERLLGPRLRETDVFRLASEGSELAVGHFDAIAYVDIYAAGVMMKFAETVAANRSLPIEVFFSVAEAEEWMQTAPANGAGSASNSGKSRRPTP